MNTKIESAALYEAENMWSLLAKNCNGLRLSAKWMAAILCLVLAGCVFMCMWLVGHHIDNGEIPEEVQYFDYRETIYNVSSKDGFSVVWVGVVGKNECILEFYYSATSYGRLRYPIGRVLVKSNDGRLLKNSDVLMSISVQSRRDGKIVFVEPFRDYVYRYTNALSYAVYIHPEELDRGGSFEADPGRRRGPYTIVATISVDGLLERIEIDAPEFDPRVD